MATPNTPVTLTPEQIAEISTRLSHMRHDVNNHLSLIVAAAELMKFKPEARDRVCQTLSDQTPKIVAKIGEFSAELEKVLKITH